METRFFDIDPISGAVEHFHYDHGNDSFTISRAENVEPVIEMNKYLQLEAPSNWKADNHHVARIPTSVMLQLVEKGLITAGGRILDTKGLRKWLNDRDTQVWRVRGGRV